MADGSLDFDDQEQPYEDAPASAQELIAELTFKPALRIGGAYQVLDELTDSSLSCVFGRRITGSVVAFVLTLS